MTTEKDRQQKPKVRTVCDNFLSGCTIPLRSELLRLQNRRCFLFNDLLVICKLSNLKTGAAALGGAQIGKLLG